jgi:hypothetical protein
MVHGEERRSRVSNQAAGVVASSFETPLARLLRMRRNGSSLRHYLANAPPLC